MEKRTAALHFSPKRFAQILLRDAAGWYRGWLIAAAAVAGAVIVLSALTMLGTARIAGGGGAGTGAHSLDEAFDARESWKGVQRAVLLTILLAR